jgi:hypothetical protein
VFGVPAHELFAGAYQQVERTALARAQLLAQKLNTVKPDRRTIHKLQVLRAVASGSITTSANNS